MKNNFTLEFLATKIYKIIFHDAPESFNELSRIQDHSHMYTGIVDNFVTEWRSDDPFKFEVKIYSEHSHNKNQIEARVYKPSFDVSDPDWHDDWEIFTNHDDEAKKLFDNLTGVGILEAHTSINNRMFFIINNKTPEFRCWKCETGFVDNDINRGKNNGDDFICPICETKLHITREIKTIYKSNKTG